MAKAPRVSYADFDPDVLRRAYVRLMSKTTYVPEPSAHQVVVLGGRVWSLRRRTTSDSVDCLRWTGPVCSAGYSQVRVRALVGRTVRLMGHRLVWLMAHKGAIPPGMVVMHLCDHKWCVNPEHLYVGTYLENAVSSVQSNSSMYARCVRRAARIPTRPPRLGRRRGVAPRCAVPWDAAHSRAAVPPTTPRSYHER